MVKITMASLSIRELVDLLENYLKLDLEENATIIKAQVIKDDSVIFTIQS